MTIDDRAPASVTTADATKTLTISTLAETRFLVSYGNSSDSGGVGIGTQDESPRPAATVTLTLTEGHPTKGKLILATYVPQ